MAVEAASSLTEGAVAVASSELEEEAAVAEALLWVAVAAMAGLAVKSLNHMRIQAQ